MTMLNTQRVSVSTPVFAQMSTTLPSHHIPSSSGLLPPFRDGTDPLLGGHRAIRAGRAAVAVTRGSGR